MESDAHDPDRWMVLLVGLRGAFSHLRMASPCGRGEAVSSGVMPGLRSVLMARLSWCAASEARDIPRAQGGRAGVHDPDPPTTGGPRAGGKYPGEPA